MMLILSFYFRLKSEEDHDFLWVLASTDNLLYHGYYISGFISDNYPYWFSVKMDLTDWPAFGDLTGEDSVWLAFVFTSDASITAAGPFIDSVFLKKYKVIPDAPPEVSATDGLYQDKIR